MHLGSEGPGFLPKLCTGWLIFCPNHWTPWQHTVQKRQSLELSIRPAGGYTGLCSKWVLDRPSQSCQFESCPRLLSESLSPAGR